MILDSPSPLSHCTFTSPLRNTNCSSFTQHCLATLDNTPTSHLTHSRFLSRSLASFINSLECFFLLCCHCIILHRVQLVFLVLFRIPNVYYLVFCFFSFISLVLIFGSIMYYFSVSFFSAIVVLSSTGSSQCFSYRQHFSSLIYWVHATPSSSPFVWFRTYCNTSDSFRSCKFILSAAFHWFTKMHLPSKQ